MGFTPENRTQQLQSLRDSAVQRGLYCGFEALDEIFTIKRGYPLFIAGYPHHGKSEFVFELLINMSKLHGWKHLVVFGETGSCDEVIAELCSKVVMKPYRKMYDVGMPNKYAMSESERVYAEQFVSEHFVIIDPEDEQSRIKDFDIQQFYKHADELSMEFGIKFDTTLIDPWNDVSVDYTPFGGREDKYLEHALKLVRRNSKVNNRVNIIVNHVADIAQRADSATGMMYSPPAHPTQWAGGRTWHRRAFTMLNIYRPPEGVDAGMGRPSEPNETWVMNQKAKPKGTGKLGKISLYFDWKSNRYYEKIEEQIVFAHPRESLSKTHHNYHFDDISRTNTRLATI